MKIKAIIVFILLLSAPSVFAADSDFISSVDVMKYTKDNLENQFSDAQIESVVSLIMQKINPKYIAIAVPLDDTSNYALRWSKSIHRHGARVIFRGTWSGIEGIYDFPKLVGESRIDPSAWLDKTYEYIVDNPELFSADDIWAILPERTEGIFLDQTSFISDQPNLQSNYANFFLDLDKVSKQAFTKIGKSVKVGYTSNNFSEIASGWMPPSLYANSSSISVDHYGILHTPQEMESDLRQAYKKYGKPIFLQEWGDYWNSSLSKSERSVYLKSMYEVFTKLAAEKILVGFNYWGGWVNSAEGILTETNGKFGLNYRGELLEAFFSSFKEKTRVAPPPVAVSHPAKLPNFEIVNPAFAATYEDQQGFAASASASNNQSLVLVGITMAFLGLVFLTKRLLYK